jgi:hypothetical protein
MKSGEFRLADLQRERAVTELKLMNVMVPESLADALDAAAKYLGCTKTAVVIAMLNEGLDVFGTLRSEIPAKTKPAARNKAKPRGR